MYRLLQSLAGPKAPKEMTLDEIEKLLKSHFEPTPSVSTECYQFFRRDQAAEKLYGLCGRAKEAHHPL